MSTRTLVILRHAKAAHPPGVADIQRPLSRRGRADAVAAGQWIIDQGYVPEVVLCSPARRTKETWHGVAESLVKAPDVVYAERLYAGDESDLLVAVGELDSGASTALLIGHNPAVSELSALLDPATAAPAGLGTAGLAVHRWQGDWSECREGAADLAAAHTARG